MVAAFFPLPHPYSKGEEKGLKRKVSPIHQKQPFLLQFSRSEVPLRVETVTVEMARMATATSLAGSQQQEMRLTARVLLLPSHLSLR